MDLQNNVKNYNLNDHKSGINQGLLAFYLSLAIFFIRYGYHFAIIFYSMWVHFMYLSQKLNKQSERGEKHKKNDSITLQSSQGTKQSHIFYLLK